MPSDAESRIQRLLAERRPASSAASSYGASAGGYRAASSSSYSGYRGAASRPSSAPSYGSYKPASAAGGYSYGTTKYGGSVPASGASRAIGSYTSALASRPVAKTLASSSAGSATNADDLLSRLREQRAQREARWSGTGAGSSTAAKPSYAAPSASKPYVSAYATKPATASAASAYNCEKHKGKQSPPDLISGDVAERVLATTDKPSAHVLALHKSTERLNASPRVHMRSELAAAGKPAGLGRVPEAAAAFAAPARSALALKPSAAQPYRSSTGRYYRETGAISRPFARPFGLVFTPESLHFLSSSVVKCAIRPWRGFLPRLRPHRVEPAADFQSDNRRRCQPSAPGK